MVYDPSRLRPFTRFPSTRLAVAIATVATLAGSLFLAGSLVGAVSVLPASGWGQAALLAVLCGLPSAGLSVIRQLGRSHRIRATLPAALLERRLYGHADAIGDSEGRPLRPIGATATDIAARTSSLLGRLVECPGVRIFHGVRAKDPTTPMIAHAVSAGRTLLLVESVAWPAGIYVTGSDGRIRCDGFYIGQSVGPLRAEVRLWRRALPRGHRVSGLIVVHPAGATDPVLPPSEPDLIWVRAERALDLVTAQVPRRLRVSTPAVAALIAATTP